MTNPLLNSGDLRRVFEKLDQNNDGRVSTDELKWLLEQTGVAPAPLVADDLASLAGGKSTLDFYDFSLFYNSLYMSTRGGGGSKDGEERAERDLVEAFKVFDVDGDGFITCEELESVLARLGLCEADASSGGRRDYRRMIGAYDMNSDGRLDFEEFKRMMALSDIS